MTTRLRVSPNESRQPENLPCKNHPVSVSLHADRSTDSGRSFSPAGVIGRHIAEVDILPLPSAGTQAPEGQVSRPSTTLCVNCLTCVVTSQHLLAAVRYQQSTPIGAGPPNASEYWAGYYKQTGITRSTDGGRTWEEPGIVTGYLQQTGSLARLEDGTIILAFGHKDDTQDPKTKQWVMYGQRCIVSHDGGRTFSRRIYDLHSGSMYAATVALPKGTDAAGQMLVTACANSTGVAGNLHVLRWHAPERAEVAAGGYFQPVAPSCGAPGERGYDELASENDRLRRKLEESLRENERLRSAVAGK